MFYIKNIVLMNSKNQKSKINNNIVYSGGVDIEQCGLYVVIPNLDLLKKTFAILCQLSNENVVLHFEHNEKLNKNLLCIDKTAEIDNIVIRLSMCDEKDKFKCSNDISKYRYDYANMCVNVKQVYESIKKLKNCSIIFYKQYYDVKNKRKEDFSKLNILILDNLSSKVSNVGINLLDGEYKEINILNFRHVCEVIIPTNNLINDLSDIKSPDINIRCTSSELRLSTCHTTQTEPTRQITYCKGTTENDIQFIFPKNHNDKIDENKFLVNLTYNKESFNMISKIDAQYYSRTSLRFLSLNDDNYYALGCYYGVNLNEYIFIIIPPKADDEDIEENSEQINY